MSPKVKEKLKNSLGIISSFVSAFLITAILIVAAVLVAVRFGNYRLLNVESGSMQPYLDINTLIVVKEADFDEIATGDVITYVMNEELALVTHRVVYIDTANETFTTKGDANNTADSLAVMYENVVGKVVFKIPKIGAVVAALSADENRGYVIAAIAALIAFAVISDIVESIIKAKKKKALSPGDKISAEKAQSTAQGNENPGGL
ncbi:MAG: signal peptidase I [Clostridiales bacterium]|nr:signal peptidase I [Clostridiales bacterium]